MATTTGTTRATTTGSGWCAAESEAAGIFSLRGLWQAYEACRRRKRGTRDAQRYDQELLDHLVDTQQALATGQWRPHPSMWFVTLRPKMREVHCAPFADRVVHHWLVPRLEAAFEPVFIHDSHSNRVGHGVHHAVERLQSHLCRASANGKRPAHYLQLDVANFFNSVDRRHLYRLIRERLRASLASHVGHGRHAAAWRLFQRVFQRHAWLRVLFTMHDSLRLQPRWLPPAVTSLRGQWRWFVREWPGLAVLVQTGHRFELYNDQARSLARWLTVALDPVPRQSFTATLSAPLTRLQGFRRALRQRGIAHLFLAEEGFLPGGLKRRVLRLAWWPEHPQPGLLPDHLGEST